MIQLESILVGTDLTVHCDSVLQSAASLARQSGAELHVVHVASEWDRDDDQPRDALDAQIRRVLPNDPPTTVEVRYDRSFHGILVHAADVHADLVVLGPTRSAPVVSRVQATTAERIVRSAEVPCLVVRSPITSGVNRYGVVLDGVVSDRGLIDLLADWSPRLGPAPDVTLVDPVPSESPDGIDPTDPIQLRAEHALPTHVSLSRARVDGSDPVDALVEWARIASKQWLVVTTSARAGMNRIWKGSRAARLIHEAPCSVLLVPSTFWRRAPIELGRVAVAVGPEDRDGAPRRWIEDRVAHARESMKLIPVDDHTDVVEAAWSARADLIVIDDDRGSGDSKSPLDPNLEAILEKTPVPVLVLRDLPEGPIEHVLVAVDTGELWYEKFGWARRLNERFGTRITVFHAVDLALKSRVRRTPGGEFVSGMSTWMKDDVERTVLPAMRAWLWERVRLAELPEDAVDVKVSLTDPWYAIPTLALTSGADLVVAAVHSAPGPDPAPLSPIARAVLTGGSYSVLGVVDRERAVARANEDRRTEVERLES